MKLEFLPEPRLIFRFRLGSFRLLAWQVVKRRGAEARRRGVAVSPGIGKKVRIRAQRCCVASHSCAYQQENWPRRNNAIGHPPQIRAPFPQVPFGVRVPLAPPRLNRCRCLKTSGAASQMLYTGAIGTHTRLLMSSTLFAYPHVVRCRSTLSREPKMSVSAAQGLFATVSIPGSSTEKMPGQSHKLWPVFFCVNISSTPPHWATATTGCRAALLACTSIAGDVSSSLFGRCAAVTDGAKCHRGTPVRLGHFPIRPNTNRIRALCTVLFVIPLRVIDFRFGLGPRACHRGRDPGPLE